MNRRTFLRSTAAAALGVAATGRAAPGPASKPSARPLPEPSAARLPRWRGFNLLEKFNAKGSGPYKEDDFAAVAEWGFDFVRLPMSYLCWTDPADWMKLKEPALKEVDQAVEFGRRYGVHTNLNLHRAPGYCVNPPKEPLDLWTDDKALGACAFHWAHFAKRYKGIPSRHVSFDLLNEPPDVKEDVYVRVVRRLVEAIRAEDPDRLVVADGLKWGTSPVTGLAGLKIGQSTREYTPMQVSHFRASWIKGSDEWPEPTWPLTVVKKTKDGGEKEVFDKDRLRREQIEPWQKLQAKGVGVHVGEWGAHNRTPHAVALAWMTDCLGLWRDAGWGWSLWNLRGSFGVMDSGRKDVEYETFRGHKLDRKMLDVLREG